MAMSYHVKKIYEPYFLWNPAIVALGDYPTFAALLLRSGLAKSTNDGISVILILKF
jgi:hypothetical protein